MPGPGRNDPCLCGSGRKVKRCCGQQRGPSDDQLARAHVAMLTRDAAVAAQIDTPRQRAQLADALVRLCDRHRITRQLAAAAILDLDSRSTRFIGASLLEAVAVSVGANRTPGGLEIAA